MYAILGEDKSDVETLTVLVRRLSTREKNLRIKAKGYSGADEMLRKAARDLRSFRLRGFNRYIICHDADKSCPKIVKDKIIKRIVDKTDINNPACVVVPVEEIEAWILADLDAMGKVITSWRGKSLDIASPEKISDPKEYIGRISRNRGRPLYVHSMHNQHIAKHLDLEKVKKKCPSFIPLVNFIEKGQGNV